MTEFVEDNAWHLLATEYVVDGPIQPYLQIRCPNCEAPNAFDRGLRKSEVPFECVECGEMIDLRVSIEVAN